MRTDNSQIVHCKNCVKWHTSPSTDCPMVHQESYDDDGWTEYYTIDRTPDDGNGYCSFGVNKNLDIIYD